MFAYVGCFTTPDRGHGDGINVYQVDASTGGWTHVQLVDGIPNPSFMTVDGRQRYLYAAQGGAGHAQVSAFAIDQGTGRLTLLGSQQCGGENPVALAVSPLGPHLVVANYNAATVAVLPIGADGVPEPPTDIVTLTGRLGPHARSQAGPHPHHVAFDRAGRYFLVSDKGLDSVFGFQIDGANGRLIPTDPPSVRANPGAAPRHAAFHPGGRRCYVLNELDSTMTTFAYDGERGALGRLQVISTLPSGFGAKNMAAAIMMAPSGRFLYASNRGHDSIAIFAVDQESGTLTPLGWEPTRGKTPRFCALDPAGSYLYAANEDSDSVVAFRVDQERGTLAPTGQVIETGSPVAIAFAGGPA
jgi:6-phosphogluconolactonase